MASSPFAFITDLTADTVNKTTSNEIASVATNPCTASQNTSSMINNNLSPLHNVEFEVTHCGDNEETPQVFSSLLVA